MDSAPVVAITGLTFHDLIDTRFMQDVNTVELMKGVALYNTAVTSPDHAIAVADIACRAALGGRGVAHITVPRTCRRRFRPSLHAKVQRRGTPRSPGRRRSSAPASGSSLRCAGVNLSVALVT